MIEFTPPFFYAGETGKTLDATQRTPGALGIRNDVLVLASLDADTLSFAMHADFSPFIPDQEQWISLFDSAGRCLFQGQCKRTYQLSTRVYTFVATSVWQPLSNAPVKAESSERPYRVYPTGSIQPTLLSLLDLAEADGLPIQAPDAGTMPTLYAVPKMALRSKSYADGIAEVLKYVPDAATRMDYSTTPPTLRFLRRAAAHVIDHDVPGHGLVDATLSPNPWLRALGLTIHYAKRVSASTYILGSQIAGDVEAEAGRQISMMLSGFERTDLFTSENLQTSLNALHNSQVAITAVGASAQAAAATAQLSLSWDTIKTRDAGIIAALGVGAFTMTPAAASYGYYESYYINGASGTPSKTFYTPTRIALRNADGSEAFGWYPIVTGAFTNADLTTAGATKATRWIRGQMYGMSQGWDTPNAGLASLNTNNDAKTDFRDGYQSWEYANSSHAAGSLNATQYQRYYFYSVDIAVDAINMPPSAVAAAVVAATTGQLSGLADRANFVEAPDGLAANYFAAQDWTPMDGDLSFHPGAPWVPGPGDYVQIQGEGVDPEWEVAEASINRIQIDLNTGAVTARAGASPRQAIASLMDALRVPVEDNFQ